MFDRKKKTWFAKIFAFKNHVLGMKLKTSFSKCAFGKKHCKEMGYQTDPFNLFSPVRKRKNKKSSQIDEIIPQF